MAGQGVQRPPERRAGEVDLSRSAVSRAVLTSTLQQPYVLYPALVGVLGFVASAAFGPDPMFLIPAIAGTLVGGGAWGIDYLLRGDRHANRYLQEVRAALGGRREQTIRDLREELGELGYTDGLGQLGRLREKYHAFEELLGKKLDPGEITHARYLGMAEQVFLAGLDNLQHIAHTLAGVAAIDVVFSERRIGELKRLEAPAATQRQELEALQDRLVLRRTQLAKVEQWQAQNERAMTRMDQTMAAIAAMTTVQGHAGIDLESAMKELQLLAGRAKDYSL